MKILIPLSKWDVSTSTNRLKLLPRLLKNYGHDIEVVTTSSDLKDELLNENKDFKVYMPEAISFPDSFKFRDDLVKTFIQRTIDIKIPNTNLPFWKVTAFDDFRGHIVPHSYRTPNMKYDLILVPLPSFEDPMPDIDDIFYTHLFSEAKSRGVKIVFFQLFPVHTAPMLFLRFGDYYILRSEFERDFLIKKGLELSKIRLLTHPIDRYLTSLIADPYMDMVLDRVSEERDTLNISLINHAKYRPQIREVLSLLNSMKVKLTLNFIKRNYTVRNLSETEIVKEIIDQELTNKKTININLTDTTTMAKSVMTADIIISPFFLNALNLAVTYDKTAIIHNRGFKGTLMPQGISVTSTIDELRSEIDKVIEKKNNYISISNILKEIPIG
ncbi:MAG: hypothetical protein HQK93_03305 [Nitrospirae bacterium]|nr:hypothetical protein [Nitrospirota bacterium]